MLHCYQLVLSTPVSNSEKSAFPESDCLVTADAVPAVKVLESLKKTFLSDGRQPEVRPFPC